MRNTPQIFLATLFIGILPLISPRAEAQIAVDRMIFSIPYDSRPALSVNVSNTDKNATLRVDVESIRIHSPENDQDEGISDGALIVSPMHFSLPPGESRAVRLLRRAPAKDREEVYRVNFTPSADDSESIVDGGGKKAKAIGIRVLYGMGLLIFSEPKDVVKKLSWHAQNGKLNLKNVGTVNFVVNEIDICSPSNDCVRSAEAKRLYAGGSLELPWDGRGSVKFRRSYDESSDQIVISTSEGEQ